MVVTLLAGAKDFFFFFSLLLSQIWPFLAQQEFKPQLPRPPGCMYGSGTTRTCGLLHP